MNRKYLLLVLFVWVGCSLKPPTSDVVSTENIQIRNPAQKGQEKGPFVLQALPSVEEYEFSEDFFKKNKIPAELQESFNKYFSFMNVDPDSKLGDQTLKRLLSSSTQFLLCPDIEDWTCLEATPLLKPKDIYRQETATNLGQPIKAGKSLQMSYYFTQQWDVERSKRDPSKMMAQTLGGILRYPWKSISVALYGIDDIEGSMKPVYDGLIESQKRGADVRVVIDVEKLEKGVKPPVYISHRGDVTKKPKINLFTEMPNGKTVAVFQYKENKSLVEALNHNAKTEEETVARLELPLTAEIMHNKFIVLSNKDKAAVWTGTTNMARTCMGDESNSNMAVYIEDKLIAKSFWDEFNEMFNFSPNVKLSPSAAAKFRGVESESPPMGLFHRNKRPNTQRYFVYEDGTEVRIHFSPTDDGEHRSIIPMLLSARAGDEIRIAMFGCGGVELVRAMQWAAAQGATIRIVADKLTCTNVNAWYNATAKANYPNLANENPYGNTGDRIQFHYNSWPGLNHHKTATLTRNTNSGKKVAEIMIIGSQNWTAAANDDSDENMLSFRNRKMGLKIAEDFNEHFDKKMWKLSISPADKAKLKEAMAHSDPNDEQAEQQDDGNKE